MKKIRYVLLIIICSVLLMPSVFAAPKETCIRTASNNYGVNKSHININLVSKEYLESIPCVDADKYVYDFGDVLTEDQEQRVAKRMKEFEDKYHVAIMYYSFDLKYVYGEESRVDDWAHDFYDTNDFGLDYDTHAGVYLWENAYQLGYDRDNDGVDDGFYFNAGSAGSAQLYFYDTRLDSSLDYIYTELKYGDKADAIIKWVDKMEDYYNSGALQDYALDDNWNLIHIKGPFRPNLIMIVIIPAIITLVTILILVNKNKMVKKAKEAQDYLDEKSVNFTRRQDNFIRSHTSSYTVSSSSGGGGGHHSSGGSFGGHSSGGGRH